MELGALLTFCFAVALGSYVQSATGFAMGLIVLAVAAATHAVDIVTITAVTSLLALLNVIFALQGQLANIQRWAWALLCLGQLPAIWIGVALLGVLAADALTVLETILGGFVVAGSVSMLLRPEVKSTLSPRWAWVAGGGAAGILGGLFSASGPVMGWFLYRQPLPVAAIRATLLACFAVTTSTRTLIVGAGGGLTQSVWMLFGIGLPLVLIGTWAGRRYRPGSEVGMKRSAAAALLLMGVWILVRAAWLGR